MMTDEGMKKNHKSMGKSSDMSMKQHGGEGHEMKGGDSGLMKMKGEEYCGPGRVLSSKSGY